MYYTIDTITSHLHVLYALIGCDEFRLNKRVHFYTWLRQPVQGTASRQCRPAREESYKGDSRVQYEGRLRCFLKRQALAIHMEQLWKQRHERNPRIILPRNSLPTTWFGRIQAALRPLQMPFSHHALATFGSCRYRSCLFGRTSTPLMPVAISQSLQNKQALSGT